MDEIRIENHRSKDREGPNPVRRSGILFSVPTLPPPPRAVRLSKTGREGLFWSRTILAAVWVIGLVAGAFHVSAEWSLWKHGEVTFVRVEKRYEISGKNASRIVEYTLDVPGYRRQEREDVDNEWFWTADVGEAAPVTYLPDRPQVHEYGRVEASSVRWAFRQAFLLTLVASVIPFVIFAGSDSQARRELNLLRHGVFVEATIVRNAPSPTRSGHNRVEYEFRLPDGTRRHRALLVQWSGAERLAVGATLPVLYPPDESFESLTLDEITVAELA